MFYLRLNEYRELVKLSIFCETQKNRPLKNIKNKKHSVFHAVYDKTKKLSKYVGSIKGIHKNM